MWWFVEDYILHFACYTIDETIDSVESEMWHDSKTVVNWNPNCALFIPWVSAKLSTRVYIRADRFLRMNISLALWMAASLNAIDRFNARRHLPCHSFTFVFTIHIRSDYGCWYMLCGLWMCARHAPFRNGLYLLSFRLWSVGHILLLFYNSWLNCTYISNAWRDCYQMAQWTVIWLDQRTHTHTHAHMVHSFSEMPKRFSSTRSRYDVDDALRWARNSSRTVPSMFSRTKFTCSMERKPDAYIYLCIGMPESVPARQHLARETCVFHSERREKKKKKNVEEQYIKSRMRTNPIWQGTSSQIKLLIRSTHTHMHTTEICKLCSRSGRKCHYVSAVHARVCIEHTLDAPAQSFRFETARMQTNIFPYAYFFVASVPVPVCVSSRRWAFDSPFPSSSIASKYKVIILSNVVDTSSSASLQCVPPIWLCPCVFDFCTSAFAPAATRTWKRI